MKVGTDALLLGAWVEVDPSDVVLDVGTGCGLLPLMLAQKGVAKVHGVELDEPSAFEAAGNFEASRWRDRLFAFHADIRRFDMGCRYDLIVSNPPFFINSSPCDGERKNRTRHAEATLSFAELVAAVKRLLKPGGRFALVLPERESHDFLLIARRYGLYLQKQQQLIPLEGREANRLNLELGLEPSPRIQQSTLVLRDGQGHVTEAFQATLKDFYLG